MGNLAVGMSAQSAHDKYKNELKAHKHIFSTVHRDARTPVLANGSFERPPGYEGAQMNRVNAIGRTSEPCKRTSELA